MGQGSSQLLTHTWIMNMTQKPWYITKKKEWKERKRKNKRRKTKRIREVEEIQQ